MNKMLMRTGAVMLVAIIPFAPAVAQAKADPSKVQTRQATGTPQRNTETPPGLAKVLLVGKPGILRAMIASEGSNSRLQDGRPASP